MENQQKESMVSLIQMYLLIKMAALFLGVALFMLTIITPSLLSFLFEDLAFYRMTPMFPLVPLLMAFGYGYANWAISQKKAIGLCIAIVLLFINVFNFPLGTILSGMALAGLLFGTRFYFPQKGKNVHIRAIGTLVIIIGVFGILMSMGIVSSVGRDIGIMSPSYASTLDVSDYDKDNQGNIEVIVVLDRPIGTAAVEQQSFFTTTIEDMGGSVLQSTVFVANTMLISVDSSELQSLALDPNVIGLIPNEFIELNEYEIVEQPVSMLDNSWEIVNCQPLYDLEYTGEGVVVAIVDTGINEDMHALQRDGQSIVLESYELYGDWTAEHGTMCASCVASQDDERPGIAPGASLLDVAVFQSDGAYLSDIIKGWDWVVDWKNSHPEYFVLCSNSFGGPAMSSGAQLLRDSANSMVIQYDIPMVCAAGNSDPASHYGYGNIESPGDAPDVLCVAAVDDDKNIASFSAYGPAYSSRIDKPDVAAPGVDINMFNTDGDEVTASGTSFSTPITAGVMALIAQDPVHQEYSAKQFVRCFRNGAVDWGSAGYDYDYGNGIVDAEGTRNALLNEEPEGQYDIFFMFLPIVGLGILTYPEWGGSFGKKNKKTT